MKILEVDYIMQKVIFNLSTKIRKIKTIRKKS
jgi:hypothetical protein